MASAHTTSILSSLGAAIVLLVAAAAPAHVTGPCPTLLQEGYAAAEARLQEPDAIEAAFRAESYRPGTLATLRLWGRVRGATVRIHRVGPERKRTIGEKAMEGMPMTSPRSVSGRTVRIRIGDDWPSGLYFARLDAPGRVGFAPFVVAPKRLGESNVAVVLPTHTWQAYNFRDDNDDGRANTWYAMQGVRRVRLDRPHLNRGVPTHFRRYDLPFLRWIDRTGRRVDVLAQEDLDGTTGAELSAAYDLIVFPGHHEYVTPQEYDAVEGFRDAGGNLMFLSANNFFWRVDVRGSTMRRVAKWRDLGRPEASLIGVQYLANDRGERQRPWVVRPGAVETWVFRGVRLGRGGTFGLARIEIDAVTAYSPHGTRILAEARDLLGPGRTAQMTYYETKAGAKVFAAGAFTLAGDLDEAPVRRLLTNLWERLARVRGTSPAGLREAVPGETYEAGALRGLAHRLQQYPSVRLASAYERGEAARLLADLDTAAEPWRDPRVAAAAGFDTRRPKRAPGETRTMWLHAEHRGYHDDDAYLDPSRPDTLIYADMPGRPLVLVGVMFSMPRGLEGPSPGGPITRWHWHHVCASPEKRGLKPRADGTCPPGRRLYGGSEMLHAWFTGDVRSGYAIHAPVPELCRSRVLPAETCRHGGHQHHGKTM